MAKRMFNDDEKKIAEKSLESLADDVAHINWLIEYNELMVLKGLKMNYKEKLRGFKKQLKIDKDELDMKELTIKTLTDQLENGVEEIEVEEEE
jgi:hypothetical protein